VGNVGAFDLPEDSSAWLDGLVSGGVGLGAADEGAGGAAELEGAADFGFEQADRLDATEGAVMLAGTLLLDGAEAGGGSGGD
jgi:hypothetical protein